MTLGNYYTVNNGRLRITFPPTITDVRSNKVAGIYKCDNDGRKYELFFHTPIQCYRQPNAQNQMRFHCGILTSNNKESPVSINCVYQAYTPINITLTTLDMGNHISYKWKSDYLNSTVYDDVMCMANIRKCTSGNSGTARTLQIYMDSV